MQINFSKKDFKKNLSNLTIVCHFSKRAICLNCSGNSRLFKWKRKPLDVGGISYIQLVRDALLFIMTKNRRILPDLTAFAPINKSGLV